ARAARFSASIQQLVARLEAEPSVAGVAVASRFPGNEAYFADVEVEGGASSVHAWSNTIDAGLLDVFDVPILAGRGFTPADAAPASNAVIVDRAFADEIATGGNVVGRRIRRRITQDGVTTPDEWLEIVGVVPAFTPPPPFEVE